MPVHVFLHATSKKNTYKYTLNGEVYIFTNIYAFTNTRIHVHIHLHLPTHNKGHIHVQEVVHITNIFLHIKICFKKYMHMLLCFISSASAYVNLCVCICMQGYDMYLCVKSCFHALFRVYRHPHNERCTRIVLRMAR